MDPQLEQQENLNDSATINKIVDNTFKQVDLDKNGSINEYELGKMLKACAIEIGIPEPPIEEIKAVFETLDINKDKKLSKEEFRVLVERLVDYCKKLQTK